MRSVQDDQDYFYQRAEAELRMAQRSSGTEATRAHYELAGHYLNLAYGGEPYHPPSDAQIRALLNRPG